MRIILLCCSLGCVLGAGCMHVKTDPIEVKPIHITVDVNVKVDNALNTFFGDLDQKSATIDNGAAAKTPAQP